MASVPPNQPPSITQNAASAGHAGHTAPGAGDSSVHVDQERHPPRATAVGVFATRDAAEAAIHDLHQHGFDSTQIGFAVRDHAPAGTYRTESSGTTSGAMRHATNLEVDDENATGGAATGALTGGLLGGIIAVAAALLIPGVGPVVAGGVLASALGGAAIGAAAGGLLGALVGMGVPEDEARYYETEFQSGSAVVTVRADGRYDEVLAILRQHGAYDVPTGDSRAAAMTGAVQAETEDPAVALADVRDVGRAPDPVISDTHTSPPAAREAPSPGLLPEGSPPSRGIVPSRLAAPHSDVDRGGG